VRLGRDAAFSFREFSPGEIVFSSTPINCSDASVGIVSWFMRFRPAIPTICYN
jgi:hypothetical protein